MIIWVMNCNIIIDNLTDLFHKISIKTDCSFTVLHTLHILTFSLFIYDLISFAISHVIPYWHRIYIPLYTSCRWVFLTSLSLLFFSTHYGKWWLCHIHIISVDSCCSVHDRSSRSTSWVSRPSQTGKLSEFRRKYQLRTLYTSWLHWSSSDAGTITVRISVTSVNVKSQGYLRRRVMRKHDRWSCWTHVLQISIGH